MMELQEKHYFDYIMGASSAPAPIISIAEAVVKRLAPTDDGYIERAAEHACKCADLLAELVQTLHAKGILDDEDVLALVPACQKYTGAPSDT